MEHRTAAAVGMHCQVPARERKKETRYHRVESAYGSFLRRFALPDDVDEQKLRAECKDGVLSVHAPESERAVAFDRRGGRVSRSRSGAWRVPLVRG